MDTYPVIVQAAMNSRRFPGKVLVPILGRPMVAHVVTRALQAKRVSRVYATVPSEPEDRPLFRLLPSLAVVKTYEGFRDKRRALFQYLVALRELTARFVVRLTADNPLVDPGLIDQAIEVAEGTDASITTTRNDRFPYDHEYPPGYDVEVINREHFLSLFTRQKTELYPSDIEHVTPVLYRYGGVARLERPDQQKCEVRSTKSESSFTLHPSPFTIHPSDFSVTVDYPHDLKLVERIMRECGVNVGYQEVRQWFQQQADRVSSSGPSPCGTV